MTLPRVIQSLSPIKIDNIKQVKVGYPDAKMQTIPEDNKHVTQEGMDYENSLERDDSNDKLMPMTRRFKR